MEEISLSEYTLLSFLKLVFYYATLIVGNTKNIIAFEYIFWAMKNSIIHIYAIILFYRFVVFIIYLILN